MSSDTHKQSFITRYIFSTDHKTIGKQFMWFGLFFLFWGGFQAMLIRWQLAYSGQPVPLIGNLLFPSSEGIISPDAYNQLFTMHGTIMIFWAITPLLTGAFGNFTIPLLIGADDMAFPKLNMFSFWTFFLSGVVLILSHFLPSGPAAAG
ncbi:MAG: cbb3-type cytochrome c oxidase subunit I, partial [Candidatus Omnitrophica bacterium]|nr:cbb3-type cytochrome c oxidase subunit I [Candidatus Omnitrophota bacterium]